MAPPAPQRLDIHSKILNEDRVIWVRLPPGYQQGKAVYPVLYQTDAPGHVNEAGGIIDFLLRNDLMPPLIVVGIVNTDRVRDLTPSRADQKDPDGTVHTYPTSGGADKFLDFIQSELIPEIDRRYHPAPYRIFAGHSLGGLFAVHALMSRPNLFNAYIAISPSLWWDNSRVVHEAHGFLTTHQDLNRTLFLSLAAEDGQMVENFDQFCAILTADAPKGLVWKSVRFMNEDHGTTTLVAHYDGLRTIFAGWQVQRDEKTKLLGGGLTGVEDHYRKLSERFGYPIPVPETTMNRLGYELIGLKKVDEAIAVFQRNVELYPASANVYDSLGEGLEAAGRYDAARQNFQKAIEVATATNDGNLAEFQRHLERIATETKSASAKQATVK
jgi:predicted alpha/beta superfamily hydrolase